LAKKSGRIPHSALVSKWVLNFGSALKTGLKNLMAIPQARCV